MRGHVERSPDGPTRCDIAGLVGSLLAECDHRVPVAPPLDLAPDRSQEDEPAELSDVLLDF